MSSVNDAAMAEPNDKEVGSSQDVDGNGKMQSTKMSEADRGWASSVGDTGAAAHGKPRAGGATTQIDFGSNAVMA